MKLLIVDDEIYAIQGILDSVDWQKLAFEEVLTANSYAQAVNEFMKQSIDVLLCDIEMPYGSGLDLVAIPSKLEKVLQKAIDITKAREQSHKYEDYGRRYINELSHIDDELAKPQDVVETVKQYIQSHISENITVDDLAGQVYLSADHLRRVFKKQEDITMVDYIIKKRLELAKMLL